MKVKTCCVTTVVFLSIASHVRAGGYVFEDVVNTDGPFVSFQVAAINDSDAIAFLARLPSGLEAVFTATAVTPVNTAGKLFETSVAPTPLRDAFVSLSDPDINNGGMVATTILVNSVSPVLPVFVVVLGSTSTGARSLLGLSNINDFDFVGVSAPSLVRRGTGAAFVASPNSGGRAIYATGFGVPVEQVVPIFTSSGISPGAADRQVNGIAYVGNKNGVFGVYKDTTLIADETGEITREIGEPVINDNIKVAFFAALDNGERGIFMADTTTPANVLTTIVDSAGPFRLFSPGVAISGLNKVVFFALLDSGERGLFVGPNPLADAVIKHDDPLFGSTVTAVTIGKHAFSNTGRIALGYTLANGRSGLAIARFSNQSSTWDEMSDGGKDAGEFPALSGFQTLNLPDAALVNSIVGELGDGANGPNPDRDAYLITITDPDAFYATTSANVDPGAVTDISLNTRLWLFDLNGNVVLGNDDTAIDPVGVSHATIADPTGFTGLTSGVVDPSAATVGLAPGDRFVLVVGAAPTDPEDAADADLVNLGTGSTDLFGPDSASGPFDHWEMSATAAGFYTIKLRGAHFGFAARVMSPTARCTDALVGADANCLAAIAPQLVDNGSTVGPLCGSLTFHLDPPGPYELGDTAIALTITDSCGQSDSCSAMITVFDTTDPVLTPPLPPNVTVECDSVPPPASPTATDNCDDDVDIAFDEVRTDGPFPDDYTLTRTWTATDNFDNSTAHVQTITVQDTTAPSIICPPDTDVVCSGRGFTVATYPNPSVTDNCDPNPSSSCTPASGSEFLNAATTTVTCMTTDAGHHVAECTFDLTVGGLVLVSATKDQLRMVSDADPMLTSPGKFRRRSLPSTNRPWVGLTIHVYDQGIGSCSHEHCDGFPPQSACIVSQCIPVSEKVTNGSGVARFVLPEGDYLAIGGDGSDQRLTLSMRREPCLVLFKPVRLDDKR